MYMNIDRGTILSRIRTALRDVPPNEAPADVSVLRDYLLHDAAPADELVLRFAERVAEYKAEVHLVAEPGLQQAIASACAARQVARLVVPADIPETWVPAGVEILRDAGDLPNSVLDESDGVLTGCALGIAQTGTIALDSGPRQGRRVISLLPDYHICVVRADQIVGLVPEAVARLEDAARAGRPITWISGPSATSDIELNRVEGVHGPRTLEVFIVG
jgi:L-lactate dehydrogenase complex protein LldG